MSTSNECSSSGCSKPIHTRGYCVNCSQRLRKQGKLPKIIGVGQLRKRDHPLYNLWWERENTTKRGVTPEWETFEGFLADVKERPSHFHFLVRLRDEPIGPNNFEWREKLRRREGETQKEFWARKWAHRQKANPGAERARHYKRKFGITIEQYEDLHKSQNGVCAICRKPEISCDSKSGLRRSLAVDHCHKTGKIRGLLCWRCNTVIGKLEECPILLRQMIFYLYKSKIEVQPT